MNVYLIQVGYYKTSVFANTLGEAFNKVYDNYMERYNTILEGEGKLLAINGKEVEE